MQGYSRFYGTGQDKRSAQYRAGNKRLFIGCYGDFVLPTQLSVHLTLSPKDDTLEEGCYWYIGSCQ